MKVPFKLTIMISALCGLTFGNASVQNDPASRIANAQVITAHRLKSHLEFLAHDLLEGRDSPSRGLDITAEYIVAQLKLWGVQPAGPNGSFLQRFPYRRRGASTDEPVQTVPNVIAMIPGSDSKLKEEMVLLSAHLDHVGMAPEGEDRIFNGAHDDGSGSVSILEMAYAFSRGKAPKRTIVFVWHGAEEKGLVGSRYLVNNPPFPLEKVVACLNIDMIGKSKAPDDTNPRNADLTGPNSVYLIGSTRMSTELGKVAQDVNKRLYNLEYNPKYDRRDDPERIYFRSDHINYVRKGIPALFWFDGINAEYHHVDDEVDRLDFTKLERIARTIYATALEVANRRDRPKVDVPETNN
jgi:Zn-dependent M28 family amino/carboxypeptidase